MLEQTLAFKKVTPGTVVLEAATPEDSIWGATRSLYLNKVALGRDAKTPKVVKITIEIVESFDDTPES